jgi:hypothetical protein
MQDIRVRTGHAIAGTDDDGRILHRTLTLVALGHDAGNRKYVFDGFHNPWGGLYIIVEGVHRQGFSLQELNNVGRLNKPQVFNDSVIYLHQNHEMKSPKNTLPNGDSYNSFFRHERTEWMTQEYVDATPEGKIAYLREMFTSLASDEEQEAERSRIREMIAEM